MPRLPTTVPQFAVGAPDGNIVEPVEVVRLNGFEIGDRPPAPWFNWLFLHTGEWLNYFRGPMTGMWQKVDVDGHFYLIANDDSTAEDPSMFRPIRRLLALRQGSNNLYASDRGFLWEELEPLPSVSIGTPSTIAWSGSRWIMGTAGGKIYWSPPDQSAGSAITSDAVEWTAGLTTGMSTVADIFCNGGAEIVAVGGANIYYSLNNGVSFVQGTLSEAVGGSRVFRSVIYNGVKWIATTGDNASGTAEIYTTDDITSTWTKSETTLEAMPGGITLYRLESGAGKAIAYPYADANTTAKWYVSEDFGDTWEELDAPVTKNITRIRYRDSQWFLSQSNNPGMMVANDLDPDKWVALKMPIHELVSGTSAPGVSDFVFSEGAIVATQRSSHVLVSWRAVDLSPGPWTPDDAPQLLHDAAYLRGRYVDDTSPGNGDVLTWNSATTRWEPAEPAGSGAAVSDWKASVRLATVGGNITLSGIQSIDGVTVAEGDRVVVIAQTNAAENGIYGASAGSWTRTSDANDGTKLTSGTTVFVEEGTIANGSVFALMTTGTIVVGTTNQSWKAIGGKLVSVDVVHAGDSGLHTTIANSGLILKNQHPLQLRESGGTTRTVLVLDSSDDLQIGNTSLSAILSAYQTLSITISTDMATFVPVIVYANTLWIGSGVSIATEDSGTNPVALMYLDTNDVMHLSDGMDVRILSPDVAVGMGDGTDAPTSSTVRGPAGVGEDIEAPDLVIRAGRGTGSGGTSQIVCVVPVSGSTGTTPHTEVTALALAECGDDETAYLIRVKRGSTPTLERVKLGPEDSGWTGHRALGVVN